MRTVALLAWLLIPLAAVGYHYGPGQRELALDEARLILVAADQAALAGQWAAAANGYDAALTKLPDDQRDTIRKVRLERAKVWMKDGKLPEARADLEALVEDLTADPAAPAQLLTQARRVLARSQYLMTWLMRLEGQPRAEWEPEIDSARQNYRLLAEQADQTERPAAEGDLEAAIRLARLDLEELQGLPIPSECKNCKSGQCKKPSRKPMRNPTTDSRSAGSGPPPDDSGS